MVMEVVHEDIGDANMQCTNHPYKNSTPGGICAFCLQEKLGKLVSSSFPAAVFPSSSSSSSPSFRSDFGGSTTTSAAGGSTGGSIRYLATSSTNSQSGANDCSNSNGYYTRRAARLPFVLTHKKKKKKENSDSTSIVFKRSKSSATPRRRGMNFLDENYVEDYSPHRRGFWSFLYLSSKNSTTKKNDKKLNFTSSTTSSTVGSSSNGTVVKSRDKKSQEFVVVDENGSPDEASFERKVSRSRSVGCGSRSFSGDFFERISTGFGDCTLRRVESQREGKVKAQSFHRNGGVDGQDCIKERVKCGGIFSGFMITSSSSSSSSYLVAEDKSIQVRNLSHGRSKSWGWAFASPMRAFVKPSSSGKRVVSSSKNATPNLAAIPSLLAVSG
ncbi:hypothetical protein CDL12_15345 [Handroanthus impetiginosus]|uniref:Uncharacterized protein n=1 Tax=Handroanthus impetiginosus TaxID=429701 RepID=A0A2G9FW07_9LAMI|nr:hypothetical protein CDL12_30275 [Handroanthus impetiginosus]PIN12056.1 hypothetical protein CDL12_15345 [Handroanthus impetiginosus]